MKEIIFSSEYFNVKDTLECGQVFRFYPHEGGYIVVSKDKACFLTERGENSVILCNDCDEQYFFNYFDLETDYALINVRALNSGFEILKKSALLGKGVRILKQDSEEMLFSFLISQNNNIPRIKSIINKLCESLGERRSFNGFEYFTFPTAKLLASKDEQFFKQCGLGYRALYLLNLAQSVNSGLMEQLKACSGDELFSNLLKQKGIGEKVADCACLFGFYQTQRFPVDVWIEKIYREDFNGTLTDRKKIADFFKQSFGNDSGYFQQYLFYYKRSLEKGNITV